MFLKTTFILFILLITFSLSLFAQSKRVKNTLPSKAKLVITPCEIVLSYSPTIRGFKLGMNEIEVIKILSDVKDFYYRTVEENGTIYIGVAFPSIKSLRLLLKVFKRQDFRSLMIN